MSEKKDISRQRLADFLAARLRARADSQPESQRSSNQPTSITSSRPMTAPLPTQTRDQITDATLFPPTNALRTKSGRDSFPSKMSRYPLSIWG